MLQQEHHKKNCLNCKNIFIHIYCRRQLNILNNQQIHTLRACRLVEQKYLFILALGLTASSDKVYVLLVCYTNMQYIFKELDQLEAVVMMFFFIFHKSEGCSRLCTGFFFLLGKGLNDDN